MADFAPQVLDDKGNPIVGPALDAVLNRVSSFAMLANMAKIRKAVERKQFQGVINEITLACSGTEGIIDVQERSGAVKNPPWVSVVFFNDGPNTAYVGINNRVDFFTVRINESHPTDFGDADNRIHTLYFWCDPGNTASVRAKGKY
jgi:hypothetical protein